MSYTLGASSTPNLDRFIRDISNGEDGQASLSTEGGAITVRTTMGHTVRITEREVRVMLGADSPYRLRDLFEERYDAAVSAWLYCGLLG